MRGFKPLTFSLRRLARVAPEGASSLHLTSERFPPPPRGGGKRSLDPALPPSPPVRGVALAHSGVAFVAIAAASREMECVWRVGAGRSRGQRRLTVPVVLLVPLARVDGVRGLGEPVGGGSARRVAEQCGTTVRHCVIPSSESISAQRGADVRVVEDPQGGRRATRSTDRGWSLFFPERRERRERLGAVGACAGPWGTALGPSMISARPAPASAAAGAAAGPQLVTDLRPCHAPTDGRRGHRERNSSDGNRASRCGQWHNNRLDKGPQEPDR